VTDTRITDAGNVRPLPVKAKRTDNTAALRQRRSRAKRKRITPVPATAIAQIAQPEKPSKINADVTVSCREMGAANVTPSRRSNYALVAIAYGFFALGIGINVWNATTGGTLTDMALPAALGVLAWPSCSSSRHGLWRCRSGGKCWPGRSSPSYRSLLSPTASAWPASSRRTK
jgi:hypothetical protein